MLILASTPQALPRGGRPTIQVGSARVDVISGGVAVHVPLGPVLPGRIPMGIAWHGSDQEVGGFDPLVCPSMEELRSLGQVKLRFNEQDLRLSLSDSFNEDAVLALLHARGLDDGASDLNNPRNYLFSVGFVRASQDGNAQLVFTYWGSKTPKGPWSPDDPPPPSVFGGQRLYLLLGDLSCQMPLVSSSDLIYPALDPAAPVRIQNPWGDWVTLARTRNGQGRLTGLTLTLTSSLGHTLSLGGGIPDGLSPPVRTWALRAWTS